MDHISMPEFVDCDIVDSTDEVVKNWIEKWRKGCLQAEDIQEELMLWIPKIGNFLGEISNPVDKILESSDFEEVFIAAIDQFIFYGYSTEDVNQLYKSEESTTCVRDSSCRNPSYYFQCKDCDETGVNRILCAECFEHSEHRRHLYNVIKLKSRTCCCGEDETWEKTWCCAVHSGQVKNSLPEDIESRAGVVIQTIIEYVNDFVPGQYFNQSADKNDDNCCINLNTTSPITLDKLLHIMHNILNPTAQELSKYLQSINQKGSVTIKLPKIHCQRLQDNLNVPRSRIKANLLHINDVVHYEVAIRLLSYLQKLVKCGREIRKLFTNLILTPHPTSPDQSIAETLLLNSLGLPIHVHEKYMALLLFSTMKEYKTKESLAKMILGRYHAIRSTNDNNTLTLFFSVATQLFEIPKLAFYLIANENALSIILTHFLMESMKNYRGWANLETNWEYDMEVVHRSRNYLFIVKVLLEIRPKAWTNELREAFLRGLSDFLRVLIIFEGTDLETRKTERHVEYEKNDWPVRLVVSDLAIIGYLFSRWCKSDTEILIEAYQQTLKAINGINRERRLEEVVKIMNYSTPCVTYDSKTNPVSIHLPLSRFLVNLHVKLGNFDDTLCDPLKSTLKTAFNSVLEIHVMLAEFTAGMWKLNGNPVRSRAVFYHNICRNEIRDCDFQLLQIVASKAEPNTFLIQLLKRYSLIDWADVNFEENLKNVGNEEVNQMVVVAEQFLQFLIQVLIERYLPKISHIAIEDCIKYEIIQRLCLEPSPYSQLTMSFDHTNIKVSSLNNLIEEVAIFRKPSSPSGVGTYEVRKEFLHTFNPLYYHYNLQEMPNANEFQRQRQKAAGEPECFPPSKLPKLKEFFAPMINIFQCDVMLHTMRTILVRFLDLKSKSYSETQLLYVLYLIGYALEEEKSSNYSTFFFTARATKWNLLECLENLLRSTRVDLPKDLLKWTIRKYKEVAYGTTNEKCEVSLTTNTHEEQQKKLRAQLANARRFKVMSEIAQKQKEFMSESLINQDEEPEEEHNDVIEKTCILCQETQKLKLENEVLVIAGYVQYSTVLCIQREKLDLNSDGPCLTSNLGPEFYTSSCGHVMHDKCLQVYLQRTSQIDVVDYSCGFNGRIGEFLCPLCKILSNVVLPLLPSLGKHQVNLSPDLTQSIVKFTDKFQKLHLKNPLQVWKSLSYTIHVVETVLRDSNEPVLGHLSSRHHECLENFVKIAQVTKLVYPNADYYNYSIQQLHLLLKGEISEFDSHLSFDMFSLVVTITFSGSNLFFNITDLFNTFRLIFVGQILKVLMSTNFNGVIDDVKSEDETTFKCFLKLLRLDLNQLSENFLWNYIQKACRPFLRCCVLFFSFINNDPPPVQLTESGGDTFSNMCAYLTFPQTREELFDMVDVYPYVANWFQHSDPTELQGGKLWFIVIDQNHINQLIKLPHEYFDVIKHANKLQCPKAYSKLATFTYICLVCGAMICTESCCDIIVNGRLWLSQSLHFRKCRSGLYLNIDTCKIMIRPMTSLIIKGCTVPGPYLDKYYEISNDPLYLYSERYKQLHTLWLNHGIFEKFSELSRN